MSESKAVPISILHLEDSPLDAELTSEVMQEAGINFTLHRLVLLEDFQKALEEYPRNWHYDMVLADYKMPGFDGMAVLRLLREVDQNIPFILLSGALGEELAVELLRNGATDYVLKHNMQRLPLVVRRAMAEHEIRLRQLRSQEEIRRARDEAQKANSAKGRFLGRISHELRTPLNAILGYTQLMQSDPMSDEQKHCAEQILKAGEHLLQLINEVLDITRIESGTFSVSLAPTSITSAIERAVDLVRPMARDARVTINLDSGPCDMYALVDRDRLAQVLINLLTNAIKYNHPNGHVYVECQEERPGFLKLLVRDTGLGIAADKIDRLFTPFDRLDAERESKIPGTGLGLTVAKALLEAMGGTIGVVSSENDGTIFWLEVPTAPPPPPPEEETDSVPGINAVTNLLPARDILLVESHEASRDFMERVFSRRCTINLDSAKSVDEGLRKLKQTKPDLVITDLAFSDSQGEEIIRHVKADPRLCEVPVIVTTIDPSEDRQQSALQLGADAYFVKPLHINRFLQTVATLCRPGSRRV
jgi:signal transduction histidine kinase